MSLVDHARRELELCGQFTEDPAYAQSVVAAIAALTSYDGHSGGSFMAATEQMRTLLAYGSLSPLTSDPAEWCDVAEQSGTTLYQSRRNPEAFSEDGGTTYYLLSEREQGERGMHTANPAHAQG